MGILLAMIAGALLIQATLKVEKRLDEKKLAKEFEQKEKKERPRK